MDEPEKMVCVSAWLTPEMPACVSGAYCALHNRSMRSQLRFMIERMIDPVRAPSVVPMPAPKAVAKTEVLRALTESDVRRIVRHELSYLMPDQYERRYGKGEPQ